MAAEDEEVNVDGSTQVYVPCIWRAVSIYSHKTGKVGTLYNRVLEFGYRSWRSR